MSIERTDLPESVEAPGNKRHIEEDARHREPTGSSKGVSIDDGNVVETDDPSRSSRSSGFGPLIGLAEQTFLALVIVLSLCVLGGYWWTTQLRRGPWIEIEYATPRPIRFQVDVNRADWSELALLPGVGESLARRIVDDREANGSYANTEQLTRVRGIGEKKLAAFQEYLLPIDETE